MKRGKKTSRSGANGEVTPKKALGQHFLTDESIAARIAATLDEYRGCRSWRSAREWGC